MRLHLLSFNSLKWDAAFRYRISGTRYYRYRCDAFTVAKASLALLPDYDGGDESLRIEFVGASINPAAVRN